MDQPDKTTIYESAVRGRKEFRTAYRKSLAEIRRLRDSLDRIARFGEAYAAATARLGHDGQHIGPSLAITLGRYARESINA